MQSIILIQRKNQLRSIPVIFQQYLHQDKNRIRGCFTSIQFWIEILILSYLSHSYFLPTSYSITHMRMSKKFGKTISETTSLASFLSRFNNLFIVYENQQIRSHLNSMKKLCFYIEEKRYRRNTVLLISLFVYFNCNVKLRWWGWVILLFET